MPHQCGWPWPGAKAWLPPSVATRCGWLTPKRWAEVARAGGRPAGVRDGASRRPPGELAPPDYRAVQVVIDTPSRGVVQQFEPGGRVALEFTPRGEARWISVRDDNRVVVVDTASFLRHAGADAPAASSSMRARRSHGPVEGTTPGTPPCSTTPTAACSTTGSATFPLVDRPFAELASTLGVDEAEVLRRLARFAAARRLQPRGGASAGAGGA